MHDSVEMKKNGSSLIKLFLTVQTFSGAKASYPYNPV